MSPWPQPFCCCVAGARCRIGTIRILTWGGLRGGVSVALALALPTGPERDLLLSITYIVVLLSILLQGLTIGKLVNAVTRAPQAKEPAEH